MQKSIKNSVYLHKFIDKTFHTNMQHNIPKFTSKTKFILTSFIKDIQQANRDNKNTILDRKMGDRKYPKLYSHIPKVIREEIENKRGIYLQYEFSITNIKIRTFKLQIYYPQSTIPTNNEEIISKILLWLHVITKYSTVDCNDVIEIFIYMTDHIKMLPSSLSASKRDKIKEMHMNTAFTVHCQELVIYRKEDFFKTFIHETFHNLGMDFSRMTTQISNEILYSEFRNISRIDYKLYETYCETWAEIWNIIIQMYFTSPATSVASLLKDIELKYQHDYIFTIFQQCKILSYYRIPRYKELGNDRRKRGFDTTETTPIFSYLVWKSIYFCHINEFIMWCEINNERNILEFTKTEKNVINYTQFLIDFNKDRKYLSNVEYMEAWYSDVGFDRSGYEMNTLKMVL